MNPWRRRPDQPPKADDSISLEDIEWRIGASDIRPPDSDGDDAERVSDWIGEEEAAASAATAAAAGGASPAEAPASDPGGSVAPRKRRKTAPRKTALQAHPAPVSAKRVPAGPHAHPVVAAAPRRLTLWRDVSALLFGAVAIVLIAQLALGNNGEVATGTSSPGVTTGATDVAVIGTDTPAPTSEFTIGPVINPSLIPVIEATPTPVPIITLPPTPVATPRKTPRPTVKPVVTPKPTVKPSVAPTPVVTPAPTPVVTPAPTLPPPTTVPAPVVSLSCSPATGAVPYSVHCDAGGSNVSTWSWKLDGAALAGASSSIDVAITTGGCHAVEVTGAGAGGSDSQTFFTGTCP